MNRIGVEYLGEKFLSEEEHKKAAREWSGISQEFFYGRKWGFLNEDRESGDQTERDLNPHSIRANHNGIRFLSREIPNLQKIFQEGGIKRKPKILDSGCGLGQFTDEIRERFGDQVEVRGTSLSKQKAQSRKKFQFEKKLHPDDAKWRSLLELRDFPEFDMIIDTFGEIHYAARADIKEVTKNPKDRWSEENFPRFMRIFDAAIKKLQPDGKLYVGAIFDKTQKIISDFLWKHDEEFAEDYGIEIRYTGLTKDEMLRYTRGDKSVIEDGREYPTHKILRKATTANIIVTKLAGGTS